MITKKFMFYSQYLDCPKTLKAHKEVICTEPEAFDLMEELDLERMSKPTDFGRFVIFYEEVV
jgi:hypothetical protein